ncbi:hypothetical protein CPB85DRAFT_1430641 [Mucidula mucida]|nr:hypothetical protein CPB85DRAFT_1430641 [Mucidula mucida]
MSSNSKNWFVDNWFPQEIWERIIDYNFNDVDTLKACALVCASFLPVSRLHLFHNVSLVQDRKTRAHRHARPRYGRLYSAPELHDLLKECPHLIRYVKSVALDDSLLVTADPMALGLIFCELTHIEEAAVLYPPQSIPQDHQPFSRKCFLELFSLSTIVSLDLCATLFTDSTELNHLLHQCQSLENFGWFQNAPFDWGRNPRRPNLMPPKLKSLHIHGHESLALEPFTQRRVPFDLSSLEQFTLGVITDMPDINLTYLKRLFHVVGGSLQQFRIDVRSMYWNDNSEGVFPLDFTETPNVRSLYFFVTSFADPWIREVPIPPSLRSLTLEIGCSQIEHEERLESTINLVAMGEHIAAHAEQLDSVTVIAHRKHVAHGLCAPPNVCCGYPPKNDDLLDQILIRLPDLQGKLRVMERTVCPPGGGMMRKDFDRFLVGHSAPKRHSSDTNPPS